MRINIYLLSKKYGKKIKKLYRRRKNFITSTIFFLTVLIVYLITLYTTISGGDSGEFVKVAYTLDVGHQPGYPLYILIGKLFTTIIPFGNIAWRINVMSAIFSALAVLTLYQLFFSIGKKRTFAVLAAFSFAFTNVVWSQAIIAEVYALNTLIFSLIIFVLYKWQETSNDKFLYLSFFLIGLGISNHHLTGLIIPAVVIFFIVKKWRLLLRPLFYVKGILIGLLGLSVYLYLPIRTILGGEYINPAMISHEKINNWAKFWDFFNRKMYGSTVTGHDKEVAKNIFNSVELKTVIKESSETFATFINPVIEIIQNFTGLFISKFNKIISSWNFEKMSVIINEFFKEYYYIGFIFFIWGILWWIKKRKAFHFFLSVSVFFMIFLLATFIPFGKNITPALAENNTSFYAPGLLIISCGILYGILTLFNGIKSNKKVLIGILISLVTIQFLFNFKENYQHDNYVVYDFNKALIHSIQKDSVLISSGRDNVTFPLYYLRNVENFEIEKKYKINYLKKITGYSFRKAKYDYNAKNTYSDVLQENYKELALVPNGFLYLFQDIIEKNLKECREKNKDKRWECYKTTPHQDMKEYKIRGINKRNLNINNQRIKGIYLVKLALNADRDENIIERDKYFSRIIKEMDRSDQILNWVGDFYLQEGNTAMAKKAYQKSIKVWPSSKTAKNGLAAVKRKERAKP